MEIDSAFQRSLEIDKKKSDAKKEDNERRKHLREQRTAAVPPEAEVDEDHVVVTLRHVNLGSKVRLFKAGSKMIDVYNWAGSLQDIPEYFKLVDYSSHIIGPHLEVRSVAINMVEVEEPFIEANEILTAPEVNKKATQEEQKNYLEEIMKIRSAACNNLSLNSKHITVSYDNVFNDMIKYYRDINIKEEKIHFSFSEEFGVGDGVTKDVYAKFFEEFYYL